jgi:hypothetical protein
MVAGAMLGKLLDDLSWPVVFGLTVLGLFLLGLYRFLIWVDHRFVAPHRKARAREAIRRQIEGVPVHDRARRFDVVRKGACSTRIPAGQGIPVGSSGQTAAPEGYPKAS